MNNIFESHSELNRFKSREGIRVSGCTEASAHILTCKIKKAIFEWIKEKENLDKAIKVCTKNTKKEFDFTALKEYMDEWVKNKLVRKLDMFNVDKLKLIFFHVDEGNYEKTIDMILYMRSSSKDKRYED